MTLQANNDTLITIFGGSGFLGRHLVRALAKRHYRIRVAVRRPDLAGHLQPLGRVGQIHAVQANVRHAGSVEAAVRDADIVINLVGILFERGRQRFDTVQAFGAEQVALAAANHGARDDPRVGDRRRRTTRRRATPAPRPKARRRCWRPGPRRRSSGRRSCSGRRTTFFNKFAAMARMLPALPLIGGGETKFQPVFVGDVAEAIARAVDGDAKAGAIYEVGGPEVRTFKQLMEYVLEVTERRRFLIPLPFPLAKLQATFLQYLPKPLLTPDQVELLKTDNVVSHAAEAKAARLPRSASRRRRWR